LESEAIRHKIEGEIKSIKEGHKKMLKSLEQAQIDYQEIRDNFE